MTTITVIVDPTCRCKSGLYIILARHRQHRHVTVTEDTRSTDVIMLKL